LRRYLLTIILLLALLLVGGYVTYTLTAGPALTRGGYVPTLSTDPATAQAQGLIFLVALLVIISGTIGTGVILALIFYRLTKTLGIVTSAAAETPSERSATTKPAASAQQGMPLTNLRTQIIFWVGLVVLIVFLQVLRYWGDPHPFGYLPGLNDLLRIELFKLPGTHINGLPPLIAGPGDTLTAAHVLALVAVVLIVATIGAGIGLARGFGMLDNTVKRADKLPRTLPDRLIPVVEARIAALRQPRPKRLPGNPIDGMLVALNVVLILAILGIAAFFIIPSYSGVAAVDNAVKATQIAALATATLPAGAPTSAGGSPADELAAKVAALPKGDAAKGEALTTSNGCVACHIQAAVGPGWLATADNATPKGEGIGTRATHRFKDPGYAGAATSADSYLYESITAPNAYIVTGFQQGIMPQDFGTRLQPQELADIIAYLNTLK
jgi:mono/diheme cytochrome c family protein